MSELTREMLADSLQRYKRAGAFEEADQKWFELILAHDAAQRAQLLTQAQDNAILARKLVDLEAQCKMLEKERARDAAYDDKQIRALTDQREQDRQRIEELEQVFSHCHVAQEGTDSCKQCGLDLRDTIHRRTR